MTTDKLLYEKTIDSHDIKLSPYWSKKLQSEIKANKDLEIQASILSSNHHNIRTSIEDMYKNLQINELNDLLNKKIQSINEDQKHDTAIYFILFFLFFPLMFLYYLAMEYKRAPKEEEIRELKEKINNSKLKIQPLVNKLNQIDKESEENKYATYKVIKKIEFIKSSNFKTISRLRNRLSLRIGGKTKLYYIKIVYENEFYYKIGITTRSVSDRFSRLDGTISSQIFHIFFEVAIINAKEIEKLILKAYKNELANNKNILKSYGGWTEVFKSDVLSLDFSSIGQY